MNIFVTSPWPAESAICLPDKHVVKMPLECCQMLSIVASDKWGHGYGTLAKSDGTPYKTDKGAFRNHPCTKCNEEKVVTEFNKNKRIPDGLSRSCKTCNKNTFYTLSRREIEYYEVIKNQYNLKEYREYE